MAGGRLTVLSSWKDGPRHPSAPKYPTSPLPMIRVMTYFSAERHASEDIRVRLNGEPLPLCIEADSVRGWARVYLTGSDGELLKDAFGKTRTDFRSGHIEIIVG